MNPLRWFNLGSGLLPPAFRPSIQPSCRLGGVVLVAGYIGEGRHVAQIGASSVALTAIRIRYLYPARGDISPYHDDVRRDGRNMRRLLWLRDAATIARPTPSIAKLI